MNYLKQAAQVFSAAWNGRKYSIKSATALRAFIRVAPGRRAPARSGARGPHRLPRDRPGHRAVGPPDRRFAFRDRGGLEAVGDDGGFAGEGTAVGAAVSRRRRGLIRRPSPAASPVACRLSLARTIKLREQEKGHRHILTMPLRLVAGDPAPQQLTAPCRKYSGRLHPPIEQAVYRSVSLHLWQFWRQFRGAHDHGNGAADYISDPPFSGRVAARFSAAFLSCSSQFPRLRAHKIPVLLRGTSSMRGPARRSRRFSWSSRAGRSPRRRTKPADSIWRRCPPECGGCSCRWWVTSWSGATSRCWRGASARYDDTAQRRHRHLHGSRHGGGRSLPRVGAGRRVAAGARQRRHPEPARRARRRSAARGPGAAGGRDRRRLPQRVQRPRQRLHAHEHDGRRVLDAVPDSHGTRGRGSRQPRDPSR